MSAAAAHFIIATTAAGVGGAEGAALRVQFSSRRGSLQKLRRSREGQEAMYRMGFLHALAPEPDNDANQKALLPKAQ